MSFCYANRVGVHLSLNNVQANAPDSLRMHGYMNYYAATKEGMGSPRLLRRPSAQRSEIKKAYKVKSMEWHPDRNRDKPNAAEMFKIMSKAKEILDDPTRRPKK
eukprot:gene12430-15858_t